MNLDMPPGHGDGAEESDLQADMDGADGPVDGADMTEEEDAVPDMTDADGSGDPTPEDPAFEGECAEPPETLVLDCESPVDLPAASTCTLTGDSLEGVAPCLSCRAEAGLTVIDFADFGDDGGACDLDGWELVSGDHCATDYNLVSCTRIGGTWSACCDDLDTICAQVGNSFVLRSDRQENCGGGAEEWRITQTFDTTGLADLELCMDIGERSITNDEFLIIRVEDDTRTEHPLCINGETIGELITLDIEYALYSTCMNLPSWASNNDAITITIIANSNDNNDEIYIDNVSLTGWAAGCEPSFDTVFTEAFGDSGTCVDPIPDGWNGWAVTGAPACPGFECTGGGGDGWGAEADRTAWTMEHGVDASALDGGVELCFDLGEDGANAGESILVEFSTDGGAHWQVAWQQEDDMTPDGECRRICAGLSQIDESARRNPDLDIRFSLESNDAPVTIDDITVSGALFCDAGSAVTLGDVTETASPGEYEFTVEATRGGPIEALVECFWGEPETPVSDWDAVVFRHAL
ncbi:MAG: hypothetical protein ABIJ56_18160 [Pseudomonadota bacterium]